MFEEELRQLVVDELPNCIGCNECMRVCPVSKSPDLTIPLLNAPILDNSPPKGIVKEFALNCVQCGKCVPVCPPGVRRDLMVLYLKSQITSYPSNYENYVWIKRPNPSGPARAVYAIKKQSAKKSLGPLYDKTDPKSLKKARVLFYPGCYIFNEICHKTTAILDYLQEDYETLGGYTSCCGWPQYLQGRTQMADELLENLWVLIQQVDPQIIITSCAECYAALRKLRAVKNAAFLPQTTTEYFLNNSDRLPLVSIADKKMSFHDSCHISRKYFQDEAPRQLLAKLGGFTELSENRQQSSCCFYYNFSQDPLNAANRNQRLEDVKNKGGVMVTDCITCYEVYKEGLEAEGVEVLDFNDLVYHCIKLEAGDN